MPPKTPPTTITPSQKPSIILIHGYRGAPQGLQTIATDLKNSGYDVHLPAIPPFAGAKPLTEYSPESYADFIASYIKEYRLNRPVLIGHSMGSIITAATAHLRPELINSRVILLSPISTRTPKFVAIFAPLTSIAPTRIIDYVTTRFLFVKKSQAKLKDVLRITQQCSSNHTPTYTALKGATNFSTHYSVSDFSIPKKILIIAGEKDRLIKKTATENLAKNLDADLIFLPHTGHLHNYEKPHETATEILKVLSKD